MRAHRTTLAGIVAAAAALLIAAPAAFGATRYVRVGGNDGGGSNDCTSLATPCATVQQALTKAGAAVDADTVDIGAGSFAGASTYTASGPVTVVGAGRAATTLTYNNPQPPTFNFVLSLTGASDTVSDLTVRVQGHDARGLLLDGGAQAQHVDVVGDGTDTAAGGLFIRDGGSFTDGNVTLSGTGLDGGFAIEMDDFGGAVTTTISNVAIQSNEGILGDSSVGATANVSRVRIDATAQGISWLRGTMNVNDTLIHLTTTDTEFGLEVGNGGSQTGAMTLNADHMTILGPSDPSSRGVWARADTAGQDVHLNLTNSIVRGFFRSAEATQTAGSAAIDASYDDYNDPTFTSGTATITASHTTAAVPGFVDPSADFHLRSDSPLIDAGNPAPGGPAVDFDGNPRVVDGNGDGSAVRDMGAYEFQRAASPLSATGSGTPLTTTTGTTQVSTVPGGRVAIARTARLAHGRARVKLSCRSTVPCVGTLTLLAAPRTHAARRLRAIGSARFRIAGGHSAVVSVKLKRRPPRRVKASVKLRPGTPTSRTVKLVAPKRRR